MGKKRIKKILITGAAGLCGSVLYDGLLRLGYKVIGCDIEKNQVAQLIILVSR